MKIKLLALLISITSICYSQNQFRDYVEWSKKHQKNETHHKKHHRIIHKKA